MIALSIEVRRCLGFAVFLPDAKVYALLSRVLLILSYEEELSRMCK